MKTSTLDTFTNKTRLCNLSNESLKKTDQRYMAAAIRYARKHEGLTAENPSVAALIVRFDGSLKPKIVGRGITAIGGGIHAEVLALQEAGEQAHGATIYVTLEPCAHFGKTPPCAHALVKAGIVRVVVGADDPDPRVSGRGFKILQDAGIEVVTNVLSDDAEYGLAGYLTRKRIKRPFVTLKLAITRDGFIGAHIGKQVTITGPVANDQVQLMRAINDAILVGSGTVINDDPALTCRLPGLFYRSPVRVVLDRRLQMSEHARLVQTAKENPLILAITAHDMNVFALKKQGVDIFQLNDKPRREGERDDAQLKSLLLFLADQGISTLLVEGGAKVAKSFLDCDLVDCLVMFQSIKPLLINEKDKNKAIIAPVSPQNMVPGFILKKQLTLGADVMYEYSRG